MIDPEKIRRRIDEVWATLGREADADGHELMRACSLTLIAVVEQDGAEAVAETLAELMHDNPSRAIVITLSAGANILEADVEARCWMPFGGRRQICSEQIVIKCSGQTLAEVPGVVLPLVVPDLPVVLWCGSERALHSPAFPELVAPAGRVIVDTMHCAEPFETVRRLKNGRLIADLSWTRLTRWRALLAQVFEHEAYHRRISGFSDLTVEYEGADDASVPPTALLLAGWVASTLGWQSYDGLRFRRRAADCRPARLAAFELSSRSDPPARISIARTGEACGEVRVEVQGLDPVLSRVSLPRSTDLLLLGEEIPIDKPDPIFERSLEAAARIHP